MSAAVELFDPEIAFEAWVPEEDLVVADGVEEVAAFMREWLAIGRFRQIGEDFATRMTGFWLPDDRSGSEGGAGPKLTACVLRLDVSSREGDSAQVHSFSRSGPRSRRAVGVADVAGERGAGSAGL